MHIHVFLTSNGISSRVMAFPNEYHIKFFDQTTYVSDTFLSFTEIPRKRFRE